jgi:hypothetical protein
MIRLKISFLLLALAAIVCCSCSGPAVPPVGGGGTAAVSLTLVSDTPPAIPALLLFKVSINSVTLTPSSGMAQVYTPAAPIVVDLMRLQSDSAYLGTLPSVPSGTYTVQISLSNPEIVFLNDTTSTIAANGANCPVLSVCSVTLGSAGMPVVSSFSFTADAGGKQGFRIDFNLKNAVFLSNGVLTVNFDPAAPNPAVLSASTLPVANANLAANQLELIEDFTGVVSLNANDITITSPARGVLTGSSVNTFFDVSPNGALCQAPASITCAAAGQIASVDAILNSDGTLSIKEFEPLLATQQDLVEGIVYSINSATQFNIAVTDKVQSSANSLIGGVNTGDLLTVNLAAVPQPFLVDTKGLAVQTSFAGNYGLFANQTTTSAIHPGQAVAVRVSALTPASGTTLASATVDTVILRWTRLRANVISATSATVNINTLASYFGFSSTSQQVVQSFLSGALGTDGVTNLDGFAINTSSLIINQPVGLRVLYLQNTGNTSNPTFFAAKIRQH